MLGLDTNVILRLLVEDDEAQTKAVLNRLKQAEQNGIALFISDLALAETVWAMKSRYKVAKRDIVLALTALFENSLIEFECGDDFVNCIETYAVSKIDLADILIARQSIVHGCSATLSFDIDAVKLGLMSPVIVA